MLVVYQSKFIHYNFKWTIDRTWFCCSAEKIEAKKSIIHNMDREQWRGINIYLVCFNIEYPTIPGPESCVIPLCKALITLLILCLSDFGLFSLEITLIFGDTQCNFLKGRRK